MTCNYARPGLKTLPLSKLGREQEGNAFCVQMPPLFSFSPLTINQTRVLLLSRTTLCRTEHTRALSNFFFSPSETVLLSREMPSLLSLSLSLSLSPGDPVTFLSYVLEFSSFYPILFKRLYRILHKFRRLIAISHKRGRGRRSFPRK